MISSCSYFYKIREIDVFQQELDSVYSINNIVNHFPHYKDNKIFRELIYYSPNTQFNSGALYYLSNLNNIEQVLTEHSYIDTIEYFSKNAFILDNGLLWRKGLSNIIYRYDSIDVLHSYPIPVFDNIDFGLGEEFYFQYIDTDVCISCDTSIKKEHNDTLRSNKFVVPNDFNVYIIDALAGNFWRKKNNVYRPSSLGKWKNGYSRGIAISRSKKIICYWVIIW